MLNVFVNGFVGNLGTLALIENKFDALNNYFSYDFINKVRNDIIGGENPLLFLQDSFNYKNQNTINNYNIKYIEPIEKGGVLTALWKICDNNSFGLKYSLRQIPILQGTVEISNYFDINPYRLLTNNSSVIIAELDENYNYNENDSDKIVYSNSFNIIGEITNSKKRVRIDGETESFLTKDYKDEIDKVLNKYTKKGN